MLVGSQLVQRRPSCWGRLFVDGADMTWKMHTEEFVHWAKGYDGPKFHAVLSDPPYGLRFMGKDWDRVSAKEWGEATMPLLYPGAIVLMFGGTRTWHKLATGMEEAGFEIWDTLMWLHGQGFPKAQAIDKLMKQGGNQWSGHKTAALKPAWEPVLCFRAPRQGKNYAELAMEYGSGALNVDGGRIGTTESFGGGGKVSSGYGRNREYQLGDGWQPGSSVGRYPANLVLDEESAEMLDEQTGVLCSGQSKPEYRKRAANNVYGRYANDDMPINVIGDKGGASRFFYCAKASRSERGKENNHPTVKPITLTKWLATLLLPPDSAEPRRLLVPFAGSGSEMIGAIQAGWDEVVGVEQDSDYSKIARCRLEHWKC